MRRVLGEILDEARQAFARQAWSVARSAYASAIDQAPLTLDDIERHAIAAHLVGEEAERSEEHTSELQSHHDIVCRLLLEKKKSKGSSRFHFTSSKSWWAWFRRWCSCC